MLSVFLAFAFIWLLIPAKQNSGGGGGLTAAHQKNLQGSEWDYCAAPLQGQEGSLASSNGLQLRMLQILIRHGDRSPIHSLTSERPYYSCKFSDDEVVRSVQRFSRYEIVGAERKANMDYLGPKPEGGHEGKEDCCPGQLTERGFKQQLANGRDLRLKYPTLILDSPDEVYFR